MTVINAQQEAHDAARKHKTDRQILKGVFAFDRQAARETLDIRATNEAWSRAQLDRAHQWLEMLTGVEE